MNSKYLTGKKVFKVLASIACIGVSAGCNNGASVPMVSSGLFMTGSSKAATVAQAQPAGWKKFFSLSTALALTPPALLDKSGAVVSLNQAWIAIKEIELKAGQSRDSAEIDGAEISFKGPYFVDLLSNAPLKLDTGKVPAVPLHRIKMKLEKSGSSISAGAPSQLSANSIYLTGTVAGVNFTYLADDGTELEISGANSAKPKEGRDLVIAIQFANIIKQVNLSVITTTTTISSTNRVAGANLCPSIDPSAGDLYTCFRKGIAAQGDFGIDSGSHDLGPTDEHVK